ncbi:protein IQ-DOMAIN 32-like [Tasmannia lanceolata]|uniref:protein IQ-DOMAIN 32-like n=1 Tax=Tasmannia lanceolata TaxID=3420 RepID=UPI004063B233
MGRSSSSCLKIITCGSDSAEIDDVEPSESKASTDRRGWSFRKRSARHRVLSNTVISELLSAGNKENPETTTTDFHAQANSTLPEKISVPQWTDETPPLPSAAVDFKVSDALPSVENNSIFDYNLQESVVIVIQTAIRGYLSQNALCKLKNVVKLQAAVRGHLVRRQAVGTLRCVQAIIKMQALVRAHRVRMSLEGLAIQEKLGAKLKTNNKRASPLGKENSSTEANGTHSSTKKLLANGFARQLLKSTAKTKPIRINCDSSKPNSAWQWLERWMSASPSDVQLQIPQLNLVSLDQGEKTKVPEVIQESRDLKSGTKETKKPFDGEENLITNDGDDFDFHAENPITSLGKSSNSAMESDVKEPQLEDTGVGIIEETSTKTRKPPNETPNSYSSQIPIQSDETLQSALGSISHKPEVRENSVRTTKRLASEQLETEGKKSAFGPRKACNPAFVAVQSKFEELTSNAISHRSVTPTYRDDGVESGSNSPISHVDSATKTTEFSQTEDLISHDPRIQIVGSECGTELSISSTLDSLERSEIEGGAIVHEINNTDRGNPDANNTTDDDFNLGNLDAKAKNPSLVSDNLPNSSYMDLNDNYADSVAVVDPTQAEQKPFEQSASDMQTELDILTNQPLDSSSPVGSPRSHVSVLESQGTPSSQISVNAKRSKSDNSKLKRRSQSVGKRSPSNHVDSGAKSSMELPKDQKYGKRRNSFDHEPRISSSNSLPSYMQATESARAKAHMNNSPKSSPDVQDKDIYTKKRHSLPVANGKQVSPRMQRSGSQAQQNVKGNGTHSPHTERKWQR